jgi:ABC-type sugar transport system ATPase subunit
MDEPTSALTDTEVAQLFKIIRQLREKNTSVVYISHKLDEIRQIADRVSVFRDGEYIGTKTRPNCLRTK